MLIDFNKIKEITISGANNGSGKMSAKLHFDDDYRIIPSRLHPGASIGYHRQRTGDDINYVISGTGKAVCDGVVEELRPGTCHICYKDSLHSIVNTGDEDLVMLTVVVKKARHSRPKRNKQSGV